MIRLSAPMAVLFYLKYVLILNLKFLIEYQSIQMTAQGFWGSGRGSGLVQVGFRLGSGLAVGVQVEVQV